VGESDELEPAPPDAPDDRGNGSAPSAHRFALACAQHSQLRVRVAPSGVVGDGTLDLFGKDASDESAGAVAASQQDEQNERFVESGRGPGVLGLVTA
jgi:hypothetical protein